MDVVAATLVQETIRVARTSKKKYDMTKAYVVVSSEMMYVVLLI